VRHAAPLLVTALLAAACGGGDTTSPGPTVATVEIAGATSSIEVNQQLQLTATARDSDGNVIQKTFAWTSTNNGVASVTPTGGLVTGQTSGNATINATVDGKSGAFAVTVTPPTIPQINAVTPNPLVLGQSVTITGENFSPSLINNNVTIGGASAAVTAATATSITATVPATLCVPGTAEVKVTVANRSSNSVFQPAPSAGHQVTTAVGQMTLLSNPGDFCLQFGATGGDEAYVIGVQSVTGTTPTSLTPVVFGAAAASAGGEPVTTSPPPVPIPSQLRVQFTAEERARMERWRRHRESELRMRIAEREELERIDLPHVRASMQAQRAALGLAANVIPAAVQVGDNVPIRVPRRDLGAQALCGQYTEIQTTVRNVGTRAVWLEDNANPTGGFTSSDFTSLSNQWDTQIYPNDIDYFGQPSDLDGNSRIVIVVTKEVNKFEILGFATTADFRPRSQCASSDFGEIFYSRAPDPSGTVSDAYTREVALQDAPILLAHEFSHIIQFAGREALGPGTPIPTIWELEGQATLAEEVFGHLATGRQPGQNYDWDVAFTGALEQAIPSETPWYAGGFIDLFLHYGLNLNCSAGDTQCLNTRLPGAPEQCTWLEIDNAGPCIDGREVYGVPWSILRWISDHYGPNFPGGEKELHRKLIANTATGFANLEGVTGQPVAVLLTGWAASLYVDDRIQNLAQPLRFPSWNLLGIANRFIETARLVPNARTFSTFTDQKSVRHGSTLYYRIASSGRPATAVRARTTGEALLPGIMRVWIVRER
jgi:hypothetical protein